MSLTLFQVEEEYDGPIREINLESLAEEELECMREAEAAKEPQGQGAVGGEALVNGKAAGKDGDEGGEVGHTTVNYFIMLERRYICSGSSRSVWESGILLQF